MDKKFFFLVTIDSLKNWCSSILKRTTRSDCGSIHSPLSCCYFSLSNVELHCISFTLSTSALPMGGLQAWSWTVAPHTPQPFQCMMAMSCSKVSIFSKIVTWWLSTCRLNLSSLVRKFNISEDSCTFYSPKSSIDECVYPLWFCGAICW